MENGKGEESISDEVLASLGLTREAIQQVQEEQARQREAKLKEVTKIGRHLKATLAISPPDYFNLGDGYSYTPGVNPIRHPADVLRMVESALQDPNELMARARNRSNPISEGEVDEFRTRLRYLLQGFGLQTITELPYDPIGLKAVHISTKGGLLKNPEAMEIIKTKVGDDLNRRVAMAKAIQKVLDEKNQAVQTSYPPLPE